MATRTSSSMPSSASRGNCSRASCSSTRLTRCWDSGVVESMKRVPWSRLSELLLLSSSLSSLSSSSSPPPPLNPKYNQYSNDSFPSNQIHDPLGRPDLVQPHGQPAAHLRSRRHQPHARHRRRHPAAHAQEVWRAAAVRHAAAAHLPPRTQRHQDRRRQSRSRPAGEVVGRAERVRDQRCLSGGGDGAGAGVYPGAGAGGEGGGTGWWWW